MRAIFQQTYGGPDVLELGERPDPTVGPDIILVRVRAAGVNPVDWKIREGYLQGAFPHALPNIPGWDVAGVVEAVGPAVKEFKAGDEVLGYVRKDVVQDGAYAELISVSKRHLAHKPAGVSFEAAAALPLAGLTAWQSLDAVGVGEGDTVLVHAAAGGVGHFAVQIAKARGARVIGTASQRNHEHLRALGAEPVEYGPGLVEAVRAIAPDGVDAAVDYVGGESITQSVELVSDPQRTASNVDPQAVLEAGGQYCFVEPNSGELQQLVDMVAAGTIIVDIEKTFPLEQAADAHRQLQENHVRGKLVITVDPA
jgi:NADPH:quinone reductase-like Zn-dependent oxidoreductase